MRRFIAILGALGLAATAMGCGGDDADGEGNVTFTTWGEGYIEEEIPAADFEDGWSVRYSKFLVVIGGVQIADDQGAIAAEMKGSMLFDHKAAGPKPVTRFDALPAKAWTKVSYRVPVVGDETSLGEGATAEDLAAMKAGKYAVYVEGEAQKGAVTKTFQWGFGAPTLYADCEGDKDGKVTPGVVVTNGGTDEVELTIHGDHLFYDDLQAESAKLRFEAIAAADADGDGAVTQAELAAVKLVSIDPANGGYGTGAAGDIDDLGAFVAALSRTLGHFRGEGECFVTNEE